MCCSTATVFRAKLQTVFGNQLGHNFRYTKNMRIFYHVFGFT